MQTIIGKGLRPSLAVAVACFVIACSSSDKGGSRGSGGAGGGGGAPGSGGAEAGGTVSFSGKTVTRVTGAIGGEPLLAGVRVCVVDPAGMVDASVACATTDAKGEFTLTGLTPNTPILVSFDKAGYVSQISAVDVGNADMPVEQTGVRLAELLPDGGVPVLGWDPSIAPDPAKGGLAVFASAASGPADATTGVPGLYWTSGVSFTITPSGGDGPYYVNFDESWAPGATSTVGGWGASFLNLTPGEYTISVTSASHQCGGMTGGRFGWGQVNGTSKAVVIAGRSTGPIGFYCPL